MTMGRSRAAEVAKEPGPQPDGVHFEGKPPFVLREHPWKPPLPRKGRAPDVLDVVLDEAWSEMRTQAVGRPVWSFEVHNENSGHAYQTELFEGVRGEVCATCNCLSRVPCKHIYRCLTQVLVGTTAEVVKKFNKWLEGKALASAD